MSPLETALAIAVALIGSGALAQFVTKRVKPVVTMADILTQVQKERDGLREQNAERDVLIENIRAESRQAVADVKAEARKAIADLRAERDATIGDLRTQMRVLLAENAELRDYAHDLRADITNQTPPPPRDWPKGLPA